MEENKTELKIDTSQLPAGATASPENAAAPAPGEAPAGGRLKTRSGSGYLKQLYSTARTSASSTHTNLKNTTFLVNFVPVDKVDASELQVRVHFDDAEITALAYSVKTHGVLQPILVVQDGDRYKVIAGERRLRAAKEAGLERIPARVLSTDDKATHEIALRENLDRVDLHPIEEGEGYLSLLESQAYTSHDTIAKAFGKPKSRITECVGFTRLPETTKQELLRVGQKSRSLLRQLMIVPTEKHMDLIAQAEGQEETLALQTGALSDASGAAGAKEKKLAKPFVYVCDDKVIAVPSFKWKATDDREKLMGYAEALKRLVDAIEDRLTR